MHCRSWPAALIPSGFFVIAILNGASTSHTAEPVAISPKLVADVRQALELDVEGKLSDRETTLAALRQRSDDYGLAHWYHGEIKLGGTRWTNFDSITQDRERQAVLADYETARAKSTSDIKGHLRMAEWCGSRNLKDRERFHLFSALQQDPDDAMIRGRLGFVKQGTRWVHNVDIAANIEQQKARVQAWAIWSVPVRQTAILLTKSDSPERREAIAKLRSITDVAALPAMRSILYPSCAEGADLFIEQLARIKSTQAAYYLTEIAMFERNSKWADEAAQKLKAHSEDCYAPVLLSALSSPIEHRAEYQETPNGDIIARHIFVREIEDRKVELNRTTRFTDSKEVAVGAVTPAERQRAEAAALEFNMTRQNEQLEKINQRVYDLLTMLTSEKVPNDPQGCWNWWYDRNEVYISSSEKAVESRTESSTVVLNKRPVVVIRESDRDRKKDCLAAGTPIWTDRGLVAVEKIKPGDRVLSQNPQSGELTYKIVYGATVRPPEELVEIETTRGKLIVSGGHPFWIAGKGWIRARLLPAEGKLHGLGEDVRVVSVKNNANAQPSYNLLVADFHTYFAGEQKVLSHDNTIRQPVVAQLPGLLVH